MLDLKKFEGLNTYDVNGYIAYYIPKHHLANKSGKVYQHMIAAEQKLGRRLNPEEVVHHNDRNRKNNSLDNLIVFKTSADHTAYHQGRGIVLEGDVYVSVDKYQYRQYDRKYKKQNENKSSTVIAIKNECPSCGRLKDYQAKMCWDCYNKDRAKNIPPKEELYNLLPNNSMCAIGRIYGVSDNAVRKWCKKYNLPASKKDIEKEFGIVKEVKEKQEPTPCKPVEMLDIQTDELLKTFHSIYEAGVFLGDKKKRQHIAEVCNNKTNRKTAYGYKWRWHIPTCQEIVS